ncbi:MAG: response regulator [Treponema sp.]|nr:response regulator [Treponema sp.]
MGKVIFTGSKYQANAHLSDRIKAKLDCEFMELDEKTLTEAVEGGDVSLIVVHLSGIPDDKKGELARILYNMDKIPFILSGTKEELHKYFERTQAKILRYIKTPIKLSEFLSEIKRILRIVDEKNVDISELLDTESNTIMEKEPPKHILVVDDDPVVLRSMSNILNGLFRVSVVKSGYGALSFLENEKPDLILLDYQMPVCDGVQTLSMIRNLEGGADIPVFFLTGIDDAEMVKNAISLHPQDYILKSAGVSHLLQKIEAFF